MTQAWHVSRAVRALKKGELIAYPTEAIWGVGCDPCNDEALSRLLKLKQRPWQKGLIVVASSFDQLDNLLLPLSREDQIRVESEPTVSWLLPCRESVSANLRGVHSTLAIRLSAHPVVRSLCQAYGPFVSTSANPAGRSPASSALAVRRYFGDQLDCIVPGELGGRRQPSEIRTLAGSRLR